MAPTRRGRKTVTESTGMNTSVDTGISLESPVNNENLLEVIRQLQNEIFLLKQAQNMNQPSPQTDNLIDSTLSRTRSMRMTLTEAKTLIPIYLPGNSIQSPTQ